MISISKSKSSSDMDGMLLGDRLLVLGYLTEYQLSYARGIQRSTR